MKTTWIFIHGLESSSRGTKGQYFRRHYPEMIIEDFGGDFQERMKKLKRLLAKKDCLIMIGSSYGGTMAVQYALEHEEKIRKLILLAPALDLPELSLPEHHTLHIPTIIYHGLDDTVVNPHRVKTVAEKIFTDLKHYFVPDDHALHNTFFTLDWPNLLKSE